MIQGKRSDIIEDWMSSQVTTLSGSKSVLEATRLMKDRGIGSIIVTESGLLRKGEGKIIGIVTETDIVKKVVAKELPRERTKVIDVMTPKPYIMEANATIMQASNLFTDHRIKRIPITKKGSLAGIFTVTDLMTALVKLGKLYEIGELVKYIAKKKIGAKEFGNVVMADKWMSPDIITCTSDQTVLEIAKLMDNYMVGDIVVMNGEEIEGIVTDTDIVRRVCAENRDPKTSKAIEVMSTPVISAAPTATLIEIANMMNEKKIKRVVITNNDKLVGLLSVTDLTDALLQLNNFAQAHKIIDMLYEK